MKRKLFTLALAVLTIGLLGACKKDLGPEKSQVSDGIIPGEFSVSADKKVNFSQGNLYWDGESFKFEANQYDFRKNWTSSHLSHFFWSKTASVALAKYYSESDIGGSEIIFTNATGETPNTDFTVNGVTGKFRTLSIEEWGYLFETKSRMVYGKPCYSNAIDGITIQGESYNGVFLYPDNYNGDIVSEAMTWEQINLAGIVFLPAAGTRYETFVSLCGVRAYYWSSVSYDETRSFCISCYSNDIHSFSAGGRDFGYAIRLVADCQ